MSHIKKLSPLVGESVSGADERGKCEQTQKNGNKCEKKVKDDFYRATLNTCLSFLNEVKNLAKDTGIKDSNLCTQTCPYRLARFGTSQPKAKRLIAFSRRYAPKNTIRLPSLLITTAQE